MSKFHFHSCIYETTLESIIVLKVVEKTHPPGPVTLVRAMEGCEAGREEEMGGEERERDECWERGFSEATRAGFSEAQLGNSHVSRYW